MSYEQENAAKTVRAVSPKRPTDLVGFAGIKGLLPADKDTRWFTRATLVDAIGSAADEK